MFKNKIKSTTVCQYKKFSCHLGNFRMVEIFSAFFFIHKLSIITAMRQQNNHDQVNWLL